MKNLFLIKIFLISFFALTIEKSLAQTDSCTIRLKNAGTSYEQGDYDGTIKSLRVSLAECKLDKEEKIQANKLLIMSYLKVDNLEEADKTAAEIMKIDPYYKPDKFKDDPKLTELFKKYQPTPIFKLGFMGGVNISHVDPVQSYSITHTDEETGLDHYTNKAGYQLGIQAEYRAFKDLWVDLGFQYRETNYKHTLDSVENTTINYSEKLSYIDVPLSAKYYFLNKNINPYIQAGASFSFLTGALSTTTRDDLNDLVQRSDYRDKFTVGYFYGIGAAYTIKGVQLFLDARYVYYPENVNKDGTRYSDPVNVFKYYYIDDDFRIDNIQINLGVSYTIYYKNQKVK